MGTDSSDRRTFFLTVINGLWAAIGAALSLPAAIYLFLPPKLHKDQEWTEAGDIGKMTPNSPVEMVFRRNRIDGWRILSEKSTAWVVKNAEKEIVAYHRNESW